VLVRATSTLGNDPVMAPLSFEEFFDTQRIGFSGRSSDHREQRGGRGSGPGGVRQDAGAGTRCGTSRTRPDTGTARP